jgi:type VI secretion system secreted protein VgrG
MVTYRYNQPYYLLNLSELPEKTVHVLSFQGEEEISRLFLYRIELISQDPELDPKDILNKKATFVMNRGDEDPININGIISRFEQRGRSSNYVYYYAELVPKMWRLGLTYQSVIYQNLNIEKLVSKVLDDAGFSGQDYEYNKLAGSYPDLEYIVQYQETDFDFINRRLEHYGIFYYFDHGDDNDVIIFTDTNDTLPTIEQAEDIYYNPDRVPVFEKETLSEFQCRTQVVTGQVKLKDYNHQTPTKNLIAESQIDKDAPGTFYEYGNHFKDADEGKFIAQIRNEEILSKSEIFSGKSDCRLFRAGFKFKMGKHYLDKWNETEYLLTRIISQGTQRSLFNILPDSKQFVPTYVNAFEAIVIDTQYRPPRRTPVPRIPGIMTSKLETGTGDEYAFIDDKGKYRMKVPFDLSDLGDGKASRPIRLSQPYSGPGYGIHFPNHADTEIVWSCIDGNVDRPLGLGTVPNPSNSSPSTKSNKWQSVIRTAGKNELTMDDKTGKENIYLHGTKDWTIAISNDKTQTIGNNETSSVGNDRTRDVGNNEKITVGNNREKSVGSNQTEKIGANKSITVGGNHAESISGNMTQTVGANKKESVGQNKASSIGAAYQISVAAAMNVSVGGAKAEEIGGGQTVAVASDSGETIGKNQSVSAGENISQKAGKDISLQAGKKMSLACGDDFAIAGGKKGAIAIKNELAIGCGKASITLKKNGDITINGKKITIKGSGDVIIKGKKILLN